MKNKVTHSLWGRLEPQGPSCWRSEWAAAVGGQQAGGWGPGWGLQALLTACVEQPAGQREHDSFSFGMLCALCLPTVPGSCGETVFLFEQKFLDKTMSFNQETWGEYFWKLQGKLGKGQKKLDRTS